jgi:hypothetical protein
MKRSTAVVADVGKMAVLAALVVATKGNDARDGPAFRRPFGVAFAEAEEELNLDENYEFYF